jgi:hypothetical protein
VAQSVRRSLPSVAGNFPVGSGAARVGLLGEDLDDVDDGEPPGVGGGVVEAADGLVFEEGGGGGHGWCFESTGDAVNFREEFRVPGRRQLAVVASICGDILGLPHTCMGL